MTINLEKNKGIFIIFLAMLGATPPLSTDMYLSAIPHIADVWGVKESLINLTLVLWFASFSVSILIWGSLSDKFGRRPILVSGLGLFVVSSFLCAASQNAGQLIAFRILQGVGAASPAAMVLAIIRDKFVGRDRHQAMAYLMTIVAVAPMVAPIIGALLLEFFSWRFIFMMQGAMVAISFGFALFFNESVPEKLDVSVTRLITRYTVHFKNREFMISSLSMGILLFPFYGFIAFSAIYYISINGLSEKSFSLFFALNALSFMFGSFSSSRIVKYMSDKNIITLSVAGCMVGGLGILLFADRHYIFMTVFMAFYAFSNGMSRPLIGSIIVGLVKTDVGSASSFLTFYQFMSGAVCMGFITYHWSDPVLVFGLMAFITPVVVMILWKMIANTINPEN